MIHPCGLFFLRMFIGKFGSLAIFIGGPHDPSFVHGGKNFMNSKKLVAADLIVLPSADNDNGDLCVGV